MSEYAEFLERRAQIGGDHGFAPVFMPDFLRDFQSFLVDYSIRKGRSAMFTDCGTGKTPMQLVWSENVVRKMNGAVLIATPLAVSHQTIREAEKFGLECRRSADGRINGAGIYTTNYERLEKFDPSDFVGMVCDESSILKNFNGKRRGLITNFMRKMPYRLLCTATAAPNDYIELGTSSEALGEMGHMDMLGRFFRNEQNALSPNRLWRQGGRWRFKGHAETHFWRWICSWARAMRRPSDLGFDDDGFILPPLEETSHVVAARRLPPGALFNLQASNIREEREERRRTIQERCERVAELVADSDQALLWCHLNDEGDRLTRLIDGARQVKGGDPDDAKEDLLMAFAAGDLRFLVTKPKIGAWGLNLQRCAHVTFFPSHSYEQYYQGVRRCWRFGQTRPVRVDIVATDGELGVMENLKRKADQADRMFSALVEHMGGAMKIDRPQDYTTPVEAPAWL